MMSVDTLITSDESHCSQLYFQIIQSMICEKNLNNMKTYIVTYLEFCQGKVHMGDYFIEVQALYFLIIHPPKKKKKMLTNLRY